MLGGAGAEEARVEVGPAARPGTGTACHPGSLRNEPFIHLGVHTFHSSVVRVQGCKMYHSIFLFRPLQA
jgi:hypothetical protein